MAQIHPLSLAYLPDEVEVFDDVRRMLARLDAPKPQPVRPMLATQVDPALQYRLPLVQCNHDPLTTELNQVLLKRYDLIKSKLVCQSQIADEIVRRADTEVTVLMLVDGLSYADLKRHASEWLESVTPVLVDGVSVTVHGMLRIIGKPPLAHRLHDIGFRRALGFTYWERDEEPLTNRLFTGFGDRVLKVKSFDEVMQVLEGQELQGAFVQIVHAGLDGTAHHGREAPDVTNSVVRILSNFERLRSFLERRRLTAWVHLVSDHGILWAHDHELRVLESAAGDHVRYYEYERKGQHTLVVEFEGRSFALLEYPYVRRRIRSDEWGVHGGLSFEESIVPWLACKVEALG